MVCPTGHNKSTRQLKGPSALWTHSVKAGICDMTAGKDGGIASRSSPISILFASLEKGTKVEQRTGQESHKQSANKLFSTAENTV